MTDHGIQKFCHFIIFPRNTNSDLEKRQKYTSTSAVLRFQNWPVRADTSLSDEAGHHFVTILTGSHRLARKLRISFFEPQPQPLTKHYAKDDVLIATTVRISIFWDATPCSLIIIHVLEQHAASMFRIKDRPLWRTG